MVLVNVIMLNAFSYIIILDTCTGYMVYTNIITYLKPLNFVVIIIKKHCLKAKDKVLYLS